MKKKLNMNEAIALSPLEKKNKIVIYDIFFLIFDRYFLFFTTVFVLLLNQFYNFKDKLQDLTEFVNF